MKPSSMTSLNIPPTRKKKDNCYFLISLRQEILRCVGEGEDTIHMVVQDLVPYYYHIYAGHQTPVLKLGSKCASPLSYHIVVLVFSINILSYNQDCVARSKDLNL